MMIWCMKMRGEEVKEEDETLQCDLCEMWKHLKCIKVCDRLSHECYVALTQSICKLLFFNCTKCRRKGTLARRLLHAEVLLKYEKERLESQLDVVCYELTALKLEHKVTTAITAPVHTTVAADNVASGRHRLPKPPVTVSPVYDPAHGSERSVICCQEFQ